MNSYTQNQVIQQNFLHSHDSYDASNKNYNHSLTDKIIARYKQQNHSLRLQLNQLNQRLTMVLEKQSNKLPHKNKFPSIVNTKDQILKRQLQNVYKILDQNKKQHKHLQQQLEQKESQIQQFKKEIKDLTTSGSIFTYRQLKQGEYQSNKTEVTKLKKILRNEQKIKNMRFIMSQQKNKQVGSQNYSKSLTDKEEEYYININNLYFNQQNWNYLKRQCVFLNEAKNQMQMKLKYEISELKKKINILQNIIEVQKLGDIQMSMLSKNNKSTKNNQLDNIINSVNIYIQQNDKNLKPHNHQSLQLKSSPKNSPKQQFTQNLQSYLWGRANDRKWSDVHFFRIYHNIQIIGGIVWLTDFIIGIKFNYKAESKILYAEEHMYLAKSKECVKTPFQFKNNDYLKNVMIYELDGKLVGIIFISKEKKIISIGKKNGKLIDLGIKANQKPVYAFGSLGSIYDSNKQQKSSVITSIGFQAVCV